MEPPTSERILFSFRESNWLDGLARGLQEALARLCGQNVVSIIASRYAHLVRRDAAGVPMELQPHPELRHHAEHLDFMLYQTQRDLDASRAYANQTHAHITEQGGSDSSVEDDDGGIDIQGGDAFLSDDNDFEEDENTEEEDYEFLEAGPDDYMAPPNRTNDAMLQLLQTMLADRETERAERQANLIALQNIANQGHRNHDHPGSKLKNFQNTNPPVFSKTEEPLDADDWLQTMENNLEVAGVEANEKVLFATHYLAGPARAWWTSTRAMNGGQFMTWEDFKLKFSKYHVPPGLIKKMRDEFRELKQGRMTVVEYRDKFLTLSRYAPDETDTVEKRKERFMNGLYDEMQTVLVNIPFADLEALVDSAIQMEGKLNQANENRKRRMANQSGSSHPQKFRPSSSGGFTPRNNKPQMQNSRPGYQNWSGGNSKPGGSNNNYNNNNYNRAPPRAPNNNNTNTNTAPRTGSNAVPVANKQDKTTITCYECGVVGHYSNECPKRLAKLGNTAAPAQTTPLQMAPLALYGRKCRTPLNWSEVGESQVFGPDVLREAEEKVHKIREYLKTTQSIQKSYADKRRREMTFEIGDFVYLKVSPLKGMQRFQLKGKLAPRYVRPFQVLSRRGEVSYQLELPEEMSAVHDVFHISLLRKCLEVPEKTEVFKNIDHRSVDINKDLTYREVPIRIWKKLTEPPSPEASSFEDPMEQSYRG
ncbi:hypothetical protein QYE76_056557 [Lolium multiflorum]|uniref:CCHC-type domain-containing protein n=1 Tax=Lolium multiflorum TaxID=4521 RepID=A0AAD8T1W9_LOLMU|nr:hypothetical protein QYE76_056557 [Lolium multiflorum]